MIAELLRTVFDDLDLDDRQRSLVPVVVPRRLREIGARGVVVTVSLSDNGMRQYETDLHAAMCLVSMSRPTAYHASSVDVVRRPLSYLEAGPIRCRTMPTWP
jgi:hypothetical protein